MFLLRRPDYWPASGWRDPFEELERMRRQMDLMSTALFRAPSGETAAGVFPMMNVTEDKDSYYLGTGNNNLGIRRWRRGRN